MKVLFMTNVPSPYRVDFFNELGKLCDLTVLFETHMAKSRNHAWTANDGIQFKAVFLKGIRTGEAEAFCPEVLKYLSEKKYNMIVVGMYSSPTGMFALQYMKIKKIKFVLSLDGGLIKKERAFNRFIKTYFISAANAWLSTGRVTTNYLKHYGAKQEKIYVYPFTSLKEKDLDHADLFDVQMKYITKNSLGIIEEKIILSVGRFSYEGGYGKGYDTLLRMARKLPDNIAIYIVGDEPTEEFIKWKESEKLTHVYFISFKDKEELKKYYRIADLFVLMTKYDVWGLVINEAMSFGLPIISTDQCVAATELIENHVNGYIIPVGDEKLLYEKSMVILNSSKYQYQLGFNNIQKIARYTVENMAKTHMDIFNSITDENQKK